MTRPVKVVHEQAEAASPSAGGFDMLLMRQRDINVLLADRFGGSKDDFVLPNDEETRRVLRRTLCHHVGFKSPVRRIRNWLAKHCPWMSPEDVNYWVRFAHDNPVPPTMVELGKVLHLTECERRRLGISTMYSIDVTKEQRARAKAQLAADKKRAQRRASGVRPRAEYEASSLSATEPWKALGMSRSKWYRKGKPCS